MAAIKCVLLVAIAAVAVAYPMTPCGDEASHHLILGNREQGDRLLYTGREKMDASISRKLSRNFDWPTKEQKSTETITRIEVHDQNTDGTGGCALLSKGGIGSHNVRLFLQTQRAEGFSFLVEIYGK